MRLPGSLSFWLPVAFLTAVAGAFGFWLAGVRAELSRLRAEEATLRGELLALRRRHAELREERRRLLTDPAAIERIARERYGFAAPGERRLAVELGAPRAAPSGAVRMPESPWDRLLGWGAYPWAVPAGVLVLSAVVFGAIEVLSPRRPGA